VILDMREVVTYTDHFVIASGRNPRQTQAIAEEIQQQLKRDGLPARRVEGMRQGDWILLDYLDVVAPTAATSRSPRCESSAPT
jgi:ribosome-associated protein